MLGFRPLFLTGLIAVVLSTCCSAAIADEDAQVTFDRILAEWTKVAALMDDAVDAFPKASEAEQATLRTTYDGLAKRSRALVPALGKAALDVVRAKGKDTGKHVVDVVLGLAVRSEMKSQFEKALRYCKLLFEHGLERGARKQGTDLYNIAGRVAYAVDAYSDAEAYLNKAHALEALTASGKRQLLDASKARSMWKKEQAIRAAEAKAGDLPRVVFDTSKGRIVLHLFENEAPQAVANFITLVEAGFYDGLPFHRVLSRFGAQAGALSDEPNYRIVKEAGAPGARKHFRGSLTVAAPGKKSDHPGSVFLCLQRQPQLDGVHTVFGRVSEGLDTLAKLQIIDPKKSTAVKPDVIKTAKVLRKRDHAYVVKKLAVSKGRAPSDGEGKGGGR